MIFLAALLASDPAHPNPFAKYGYAEPPIERLGPGPHTLIVSSQNGMTQMAYKTGPACQKARDAVRRQVAPPANTPGVIYGPPAVKAFCVPR